MPYETRYRYSLMAMAGTLVGSIAILAALNLWYLRKLQSDNLHTAAAQAVLELGADLARNLAAQPLLLAERQDPRQWNDFGRLVRSIRQVEPSLRYVTVNDGDVIVFHEDTSAPGTTTNEPAARELGEVRIGRRLLATGQTVAPVLTFTVPVPGVPLRHIQVAMSKEAVSQREERANQVLSLMFRLSEITLAIAFTLAVLLVAWAVWHEQERQRRRRDEEHLAFAGILADGIIHDVRNPMSSLRLDVQMLEKEAGKGTEARTDRMVSLAGRARRTMDRVDLVMKEFLYVSKPEPAQRERVDINASVLDCLDLLGPRFERANVRIRANPAAETLVVMGHNVGLKRALINILTNAKQASPAGSTVTVSTRRTANLAVIDVDDEGPGIPPEQARRIFDMFVSGRPEGVGLGLYLAKAAVENSGGRITTANRPEGGARFTIELPLAPA